MNINHIKSRVSAQKIAYQSGLSLVELMVAITIGLIITAALGALFLGINRTNQEMAKANSQIESGRFAIQLLQADIIHAGFWGGFAPQFDDLSFSNAPGDVPTAVPNPCLDYATPWTIIDIVNFIGIPVQAYANTPPTGAGCVTDLATNKKANTDLLVVRHADTCVPGEVNCEADVAGKLYFQSTQCELENASPYVLATSAFNLHKRDCVGTGAPQTLPITAGTIAEKRKFVSSIYYVRDYAKTVGDGIPTLMISQFDLGGTTLAHQAAVPLIENIEGFKVMLGIDHISDNGTNIITSSDPSNLYSTAIKWLDSTNLTSPVNRGDGIPDEFVSCTDAVPCTFQQLSHVVAVKLFVLARSETVSPGYTDTKTYMLGNTTLGPFNDSFKRHVFSTTVRVNNVSGRRETP